MKPSDNPDDRVRLDKWLWAARFYKHRTLATEAVDGGKIQLNGLRVKPAKEVKIGDTVDIQLAETHFKVVVKGIADKRGSAPVAQGLYEETADSVAARENQKEQRQLAATPGADLHGRPTKRDRRQMGRFTGGY
ncbi:MAG: RNA-binding S4 domain-containing protein [Proteobacteria bacterium]|nr:RNA-binding S4 domain-containing protein [Pseudomonadota bacterium]